MRPLTLVLVAALAGCGPRAVSPPATVAVREDGSLRDYRLALDALVLEEPRRVPAGADVLAARRDGDALRLSLSPQADPTALARRAGELAAEVSASGVLPVLVPTAGGPPVLATRTLLVESACEPTAAADAVGATWAATPAAGVWRLDFGDPFAALAALPALTARGLVAWPDVLRPRAARGGAR